MPAPDAEDSASLPCASGQGPGIQPGLRAHIPAPLLSGCVTPGKPLDFSEPQVPHVENGPEKAPLRRTAARAQAHGCVPPGLYSTQDTGRPRCPPETPSGGARTAPSRACPCRGLGRPPACCPSDGPLPPGQGQPRPSAALHDGPVTAPLPAGSPAPAPGGASTPIRRLMESRDTPPAPGFLIAPSPPL